MRLLPWPAHVCPLLPHKSARVGADVTGGGYTGRLLRLNLNELDFRVEKPREDDLERFIGGEGLGIKYLYDEVPAHADPLGPENRLIFMTGPMTGTLAPTSGRHCVITKSPSRRRTTIRATSRAPTRYQDRRWRRPCSRRRGAVSAVPFIVPASSTSSTGLTMALAGRGPTTTPLWPSAHSAVTITWRPSRRRTCGVVRPVRP